MNYTFFIGNGFDLGMGLRTSYSDFLDSYKRLRTKNTELDESRHWLFEEVLDNPSQWSDFEVALGQLTQRFTTRQTGKDRAGLERFFRFHADILNQLNKYLKNEQRKLLLPNSSQLCDNYLLALCNPFDNIPDEAREQIERSIASRKASNPAFSTVNSYSFVSFNYTDAFDRCLKQACSPLLPDGVQPNPLWSYVGQDPTVLHLHGKVDSPLLVGINDIAQARSNFGLPDDLKIGFEKPYTNRKMQNGYMNRVVRLIEQSHFIILCGVSLGVTDRIWWNQIGQWLENDMNHHLIIHTYMESNQNIPNNIQLHRTTVLERFLACQSDPHSTANIYNRIHIVINNSGLPTCSSDQQSKRKTATASQTQP
ncbi:MAG: AbiH family protein [Candidatus Limiplasma sp.]|nr:AbiH family protein [Candidatus Limiplasma sp.]